LMRGNGNGKGKRWGLRERADRTEDLLLYWVSGEKKREGDVGAS